MMRTLLAGLALAGFAALGAPAHASEASYAQCQKAAGGVDPQLRACDAAEIASRDAVLNQGYRKLLAAISPARQALLRTSEHDWIAFRDAECAFRRSAEAGGSDVVLLYDACRLDLTARRIDELSKALNVSSFNECCMTTGQRTKNEKTRSPPQDEWSETSRFVDLG